MKVPWVASLSATASFFLGFLISPHIPLFPNWQVQRGDLASLSHIRGDQPFEDRPSYLRIFTLNDTFTAAPTPESNQAWEELVPRMFSHRISPRC